MVKRLWKVYGVDGLHQKETWHASRYSLSSHCNIVSVFNFDVTGTHDYSIVCIESPTEYDCLAELFWQLGNGIFARMYGTFEEIKHVESFSEIVSNACNEWCKSFLGSISDVVFGSDAESSMEVSNNE